MAVACRYIGLTSSMIYLGSAIYVIAGVRHSSTLPELVPKRIGRGQWKTGPDICNIITTDQGREWSL